MRRKTLTIKRDSDFVPGRVVTTGHAEFHTSSQPHCSKLITPVRSNNSTAHQKDDLCVAGSFHSRR